MSKVRAKVDDLVNSGARPVVTRNGSVVMRSGSKRVVLQRPGGKKTSAGLYFEELSGSIPGANKGYNPQAFSEKVGTPTMLP